MSNVVAAMRPPRDTAINLGLEYIYTETQTYVYYCWGLPYHIISKEAVLDSYSKLLSSCPSKNSTIVRKQYNSQYRRSKRVE